MTQQNAQREARTASLTDSTYRRLREDILLGRLRPNEMLVEEELAEQLQVSRTPVRESLQRLAHDGLITSRRRRWMVYEHTIDEIREIYEIRAALEGYAARLAAQRASGEELAALVALARTRPLGEMGDEVMVERNEAFHEAITRAAGNARLAELIQRTRLYYFNRQLAPRYHGTPLRESQEQHLALVHALEARDPDRAEMIVREHVLHALHVIEHADAVSGRPLAARADQGEALLSPLRP